MNKNQMKCWLAIVLAATLVESSSPAQCQRQKLLASDAQPFDQFGMAVAISGDWVAVGAPYADDIVSQSGAVYVFQHVGSNWVQVQRLKANDAAFGAVFGSSVAMAGTTLVIGAPGDSPGGISGAGSAYVFDLSGSTWNQTFKLTASVLGSGVEFGDPVALDGNRLLIAARYDNEHGYNAGAAYVFDLVGGTWVQSAKLMGSDVGFGEGVSMTVALLGDRAMLGVPGHPVSGAPEVGAVYVFDNGSTSWAQTQRLLASDGVAHDSFGSAVALSGTHAAIGAAGSNHYVGAGGAIYGFENQGSAWVQTQECCADDTGSGDQFGGVLAASGDHLISYASISYDWLTGSAYDFRLSGSTWIQAGKMLAEDAAPANVLGLALAVSGDFVVAGAFGCDDACTNPPDCNSGAAYVFQLAPTATQYGHCPAGAPCNNTDAHGGCRNSTGQGSILAACGSGSVTTDDLQIEATRCPAHKSTLLFMGGIQVNAPFADGIRVVGGGAPGIFRFGIVQSDADGRVMRGPGLVAQSQGFHTNGRIQPGQVWNFQVWYRDLAGPCGHLTNYSNGVQVAFTP